MRDGVGSEDQQEIGGEFRGDGWMGCDEKQKFTE